MPKYLALLRGINVGGNNKIAMSDLKKAFESLSYQNVLTYINSGNVIFESRQKDAKFLAKEIEKIIKKTFDFEVRCLAKESSDIQNICRKIPSEWQNDAEQKTDVLFLFDEYANEKSLELIKTNPKVDNLKYIDGSIVWNIKKSDYSKSKMNKFIGSTIYKNMTARNVNTVRKLAALMK